MKWYKVNLQQEQPPFGDAMDLINMWGELIHSTPKLNFDEIGIFSKFARDNTFNVYFSEVAYKFLIDDLIKFNPILCPPPSKDDDNEGINLRLHYGNSHLIF